MFTDAEALLWAQRDQAYRTIRELNYEVVRANNEIHKANNEIQKGNRWNDELKKKLNDETARARSVYQQLTELKNKHENLESEHGFLVHNFEKLDEKVCELVIITRNQEKQIKILRVKLACMANKLDVYRQFIIHYVPADVLKGNVDAKNLYEEDIDAIELKYIEHIKQTLEANGLDGDEVFRFCYHENTSKASSERNEGQAKRSLKDLANTISETVH